MENFVGILGFRMARGAKRIPGGFMRDKSHDEVMGEYYRQRPVEAAAMFKALLFDGGQIGEWRIFFRHVRHAIFRA